MFLHIQQSLFVSRTQRGIAVFRPTSAKCSEKPISIHLLEKVDLITFGLLLPAPFICWRKLTSLHSVYFCLMKIFIGTP